MRLRIIYDRIFIIIELFMRLFVRILQYENLFNDLYTYVLTLLTNFQLCFGILVKIYRFLLHQN